MKRFILFILLISTVAFAQELPNVADQPIEELQFSFNGRWLPSLDPLQVGPENYQTLQNMRYTESGSLEAVGGYSKINSTALTSNPEVDSGFHFKKDNPAETHVLVNADGTIYQNTTAIPSAGDFSATSLHTDTSGASSPRFSNAPYGHVAYANGKEVDIWAGSEMPVAAFLTSTAAVTNTLTNPQDYTEAVNNDQTDGENVAIIGGGNDSGTMLLLHLDGADGGSTYTDSSVTGHTVTETADVETDTAQRKFGVSSALFDGDSGYLSVSDSDGVNDYWFKSTNEFEIDFWVRTASIAADFGMFQQFDDADNVVHCYWDQSETNLVFQIRSAASNTVTLTGTWSPTVNTWYHIAVIRGWGGAANGWAITVNGTSVATLTDADAWPDLAGALQIGATSNGYLNGWIDEFRVSTNGYPRWTANFTPPTRPYQSTARYFLVGSPRPLQGIKFYISRPNVMETAFEALASSFWNGSSWQVIDETDGTASGTITLAQTGSVTFTSTVSTAKPKFIENRLLYWYQFHVYVGDADIYRVTLDAPWQDIVDIWDGVLRQPIQFQAYKSAKYEDYTIEVNEPTLTYYGDLGGLTSSEHVVLMFDDRMTAIKWQMVAGYENSTASTATVYYWNGQAWASVGTISDTTLDTASSTKSLGQSGVMSWEPPSRDQEYRQTLFGTTGFAYKIEWSATLTASYSRVNTVTGIPAQFEIKPFKFPTMYRDRLFLCGFTDGGEGNRCDYSMTHAPQVFNGEESSNGGLYSLYFGGEEELSAAAQLYNRMGSNIFIFLVALKDNETYVLTGDGPENFAIYPVSLNVGCPAPYSLVTAEIAFDLSADVQRHVAIWLSYTGPVIFDGAVIYKISGLETYFDPNSIDYLGRTAISGAIGWYDQTYNEYNIIVGSNWFTYNMGQKKWFSRSTGAAGTPISAWPVRDTSGNQFIYAGLDNGYMMRLENGNSWDGTLIDQQVKTGEFFPTKSIWDTTRIRRLKVAAKDLTYSNNLSVTHYANGSVSGATAMSSDVSLGVTRIFRNTKPLNLLGWSHSFLFEMEKSASETKGFQPYAWAIEYLRERKDH